jgi:hypothetical protein
MLKHTAAPNRTHVTHLTPSPSHQVMSAEANYLRVDVQQLEGSSAQPPRRQLLCKARTLLRKMRQNVLVGDRVRVVGIDWQHGRAMVDSVFPRTSELIDPAVANIDHVVLLFGLTQPPFDPQQVRSRCRWERSGAVRTQLGARWPGACGTRCCHLALLS